MKKLLYTIAIIVNCQLSIVNSQIITPYVIPARGGFNTGSNGNTMSWTAGETNNVMRTGSGFILTEGFQQPEIFVKTGTVTGSPFCPGATVNVPFIASGIYNAANVFTAQLSDAAGSFASPITIGTLAATSSGTVVATIPAGSAGGIAFRIRVIASSGPVSNTNNGIDLIIIPPSIAPTGITSSGGTTIPAGTSTTLTQTGGSAFLPVYILWYSGSCGGTFIGFGNSITVTPSAATTYYCRIESPCQTTTCASINIITSIQFGAPYCVPTAVTVSTNYIDNVSFGTVNNSTGFSANGYGDYNTMSSSVNTGAVLTVNMHFTVAVPSQTLAAIWIDYDHSGTFEVSEQTFFTQSTYSTSQQFQALVPIPATAMGGLTRMRIQSIYNGNISNNSCIIVPPSSGETEDYGVNIAVTGCNGPTALSQPTNYTTCAGTPASFTFSAFGNPLPTYQWQSDNGTGTFTNIAGATLSTLSLASISAALNGYHFRCIASNFCIGFSPVTSSVALLTVMPTPVGSASNQSIVTGQTTSVALNSTMAGSTFTWTASLISGYASGYSGCFYGCGTTIAQTLTNPYSSSVAVVRYMVTPSSSFGCNGTPFPVDVTVINGSFPPPIGSATPQSICSGGITSVALNSNQAGTTFTWTAAVLSGTTTGFSNCTIGCGTTIAQTLTNAGIVRYTVTPKGPSPYFINGTPFTVNVTVNGVPTIPIISGPSVVCGMSQATYNASSAGATAYNWTSVANLPIQGSGTGSSILTNVLAGTISGNIICFTTNACGTSPTGSYSVTKKPAAPAAIIGNAGLCGLTTATFSVAPVFGATSYIWSLPAGITASPASTTNSITVSISPGFVSGKITAAANNSCGYLPGTSLTVYGGTLPPPVLITGQSNLCGITSTGYTCSGTANAVDYLWTAPMGINIIGPNNGISVNVQVTGAFTGGSLTVAANDPCGTGIARAYPLTLAAIAPPVPQGPYNICGMSSATYTVPSIGPGYIYNWSIAISGWAITSPNGLSSITISGPASGANVSGIVKVSTTNSCGNTSGLVSAGVTACHQSISNTNSSATDENNSFYSIYPNPATTDFKIDVTTDADEEVTVLVYDVAGNLVSSSLFPVSNGTTTLTTTIENFKAGMYFVRLVDKDAKTVYSGTVVKL